MSTAEIIPIAIVLDGRTGYTLWAPPWEEDGEEWQAFLGADDKILLFSSPAQLAQFMRRETDHDLIDHPDWDEWEDADPFALVPDDDHTFDLDGVYDIVASAADRWSVIDLGRTLGIVDSIAQCCDEDILEPIVDTEELGLVADGPAAFSGRNGERAWDKVGIAISGQWETVCERIGEWIDWRQPIALDDELALAQEKIDIARIPIDDPDALVEAEEEVRDNFDEDDEPVKSKRKRGDAKDDSEQDDESASEDDESADQGEPDDDAEDDAESADDAADDEDDEDESEDDDSDDDDDESDDDSDDDDEDESDEDDLAYQSLTANDEDDAEPIDAEAAYAFWEDSGILPIRIVFPDDVLDGAETYTLRCYLEDAPVFMGANQNAWLFQSPDSLLDAVEDDDEDSAHDLRGTATFPEVVDAIANDMPLAIADLDDVDLGIVEQMMRGEQEFDRESVTAAADILLDLAEYSNLDNSRDLLDGDGPLGELIAALREEQSIDLDAAGDALDEWRIVVSEIAGTIELID